MVTSFANSILSHPTNLQYISIAIPPLQNFRWPEVRNTNNTQNNSSETITCNLMRNTFGTFSMYLRKVIRQRIFQVNIHAMKIRFTKYITLH